MKAAQSLKMKRIAKRKAAGDAEAAKPKAKKTKSTKITKKKRKKASRASGVCVGSQQYVDDLIAFVTQYVSFP